MELKRKKAHFSNQQLFFFLIRKSKNLFYYVKNTLRLNFWSKPVGRTVNNPRAGVYVLMDWMVLTLISL